MKPKTVKVRIVVAVADSGEWDCAAIGPREDALGPIREVSDWLEPGRSKAGYILTATLKVPSPETIPATVKPAKGRK